MDHLQEDIRGWTSEGEQSAERRADRRIMGAEIILMLGKLRIKSYIKSTASSISMAKTTQNRPDLVPGH